MKLGEEQSSSGFTEIQMEEQKGKEDMVEDCDPTSPLHSMEQELDLEFNLGEKSSKLSGKNKIGLGESNARKKRSGRDGKGRGRKRVK